MGKRRASPPPSEPPSPATVLGQTVRRERQRLKLTQQALALNAGVGLAFLYELERGKPTARLDKVMAVLETLGLRLTLSLAGPGSPAGSIRSDVPESPP